MIPNVSFIYCKCVVTLTIYTDNDMLSAHDRWKDGKELNDPVAEEQNWNFGFQVDQSPVDSESGK